MITKNCKNCSKSFLGRIDRGIYCSHKCRWEHEGNKETRNCPKCGTGFITNLANNKIYCSRKCTSVHLSAIYRFGGAANWKGDKVSYRALHHWVSKWKGTPKLCENCGIKDSPKRYHWANISKKYLRDLDDWIRLCVKCHKAFDT